MNMRVFKNKCFIPLNFIPSLNLSSYIFFQILQTTLIQLWLVWKYDFNKCDFKNYVFEVTIF
jgi:hypothetical protein